MAYLTVDYVRTVSGLSSDEVSDSVIQSIIDSSLKEVFNYFTVEVIDEQLTGNINNVNKQFRTKHYPLCDYDLDGDFDVNDVVVKGWYQDTVNNRWRYDTLTVSSVDQSIGKITLSEAPSSSDYTKLTCSYRYFKTTYIPSDALIKDIYAYYVIYKLSIREFSFAPERLKIGNVTVGIYSKFKYVDAYNNFLRVLSSLWSEPVEGE